MGDIKVWKTTRHTVYRTFLALLAISIAVLGSVSAQQAAPPAERLSFSLPDDVDVRHATIWSEGTRMAANVYSPKAVTGKLPTVIMAYGWGGTMRRVRKLAVLVPAHPDLLIVRGLRQFLRGESRIRREPPPGSAD